jgi:hypothetical protein
VCLQCEADGLKQTLKPMSIAADRENGLHYEGTEINRHEN